MVEAEVGVSPIYELLGQKGGGATARPRPEVALICGNLDFRLLAAVRTPPGTTGRSQHSPCNISKCRQRAEDLAEERVRRRVVLDPPHNEHEVGLPSHEDDVLAVAEETDASGRYQPKRLAVCSQLPIRESESRVGRVRGANASHFHRINEAAGTTFFPDQVGENRECDPRLVDVPHLVNPSACKGEGSRARRSGWVAD
jgi:hypothetical protein